MTPIASRHFGFLVSHPDVTPYFARAAILAMDDEGRAETCDDEELEQLGLDVDGFAAMLARTPQVEKSSLYSCFYEEDLLERFEDALNMEIEFTGRFHVLNAGVPKGEDPNVTDGLKFDYDTVRTIPLDNQPTSLFMQCYGNYAQVEAEIRDKIKTLHVELPKDFPFWRYIGCIDGVVYDDD